MKIKNVLWGVLLIAVGVIFGLNALEITDIDLFFDGWWTLFIIVPCLIGLIDGKDRNGNLVGIAIGVALLLGCQGLLDFELILKLAVPVILVILGLSIIFKNMAGDRASRKFFAENKDDSHLPEYCSTFSGQNLTFVGQLFQGAKLTAVFGSIRCDLTGARMDRDVLISADAIFGGIDIIVPADKKVRIQSTSIFGGISENNKHSAEDGAVTVYVKGLCLFGGVSVK